MPGDMLGNLMILRLCRLLTVSLLLLGCIGLEYGMHIRHGVTQVYAHFFYIPILLAAFWWGLKGGVLTSLFLGLMHTVFCLPAPSNVVLSRSLVLVLVGSVLGALCGERKKTEQQLLANQEQLRSLASQLVLTEERERRCLAEALHDRIGQALAVAKIKMGMLRASVSSADTTGALDEIRELLNQTIRESRLLIFDLSPPILYGVGLEAALEGLVKQLRKQHGLRVEFEDDGKFKPLDDDVRVLLFRAVRELLINVVKHAQARNAWVSTARAGNCIRIVVEDNGMGFDLPKGDAQVSGTGGFGLFSISERLNSQGGSFRIQSEPNCGTRAVLEAPLKGEREDTGGRDGYKNLSG